MHQTSATKQLSKVPGHTHLFRRGARYYFRIGVPSELRPIVGRREIVKSLETADYGLAVARISAEEKIARDLLSVARKKHTTSAPKMTQARPEPLVVTTEQEARQLARQYFVEIEQSGARWWRENRAALTTEEEQEARETVWDQQSAIVGGDRIHLSDLNDGSREVRNFLRLHNFTMDEASDGFTMLAGYFREARLEQARRQEDRMEGKPLLTREALFDGLNEHSVATAPARNGISIGLLCRNFLAEYEKAGKAPKTLFQYQVTVNLLTEIFGEDYAANSIARHDAEKFCGLLETMPEHRTKRYAGKTIVQSIALAQKQGDKSRLAPNTRRNRFFAAFTIFKYGVETKALLSNPFDDRLLKQRFTPKHRSESVERERAPFNLEELKTIFSAPLYRGCKDDESGYAKPGPNVIRRGRFFVPLIALFHGMRENEICQLLTSDVCDWEGGLFFEIKPGEGKRVKNRPSVRAVPVHPELLKMGFAEYVAERRAKNDSPRLFPELTQAKTGSHADNFSKWFARFLRHAFRDTPGKKVTESRFHSFRHSFAEACRKADISSQRFARICGWSDESRQQREYGKGKMIAELAGDLAKVSYRGLDLTHLYTSLMQPVAPNRRCRERERSNRVLLKDRASTRR